MGKLGHVESQSKPNPNMKYMNPNIIQFDELNPDSNYEFRVKIELSSGLFYVAQINRVRSDLVKKIIELQNYLTIIYELQNNQFNEIQI